MGTATYAQAVAAGGLLAVRYIGAVFPPPLWPTFTAIADAESTFNPAAINASGAVGLLQVKPTSAGLSAGVLLNPLTNCQAAWRLYQAQGLTPWAGDGYGLYLAVAEALIAAVVAAPGAATAVSRIGAGTGQVTVGAGGLITARLTLTAAQGGVAYRVVTQLLAGNTAVQTFTPSPVTGALAAGQGATITQTARLAPPQVRVNAQQVTVAYGVRWVVTNTMTHQTVAVATAANAVTLVV